MRHRRLALTGPPAAALYGLDGFRDQQWPPLWAAPHTGVPGDRIVRTRQWREPLVIGTELVAPLDVVVRHLAVVPADLMDVEGGILPRDRVELALEHALRMGMPLPRGRGGHLPGDAVLNEVLVLRGDEPATESYAETRCVQFLRALGITPWRQVWITGGTRRFRADLMVPFVRMRRPEVIRPEHGLLLECDSREHHGGGFDHDQARNGNYNALGYHWAALTPNQVEFEPAFARRILAGALRRAGHPLLG